VADRAILVTGASRGIGRAIARAFAGDGDRVAVHHRDSAGLAAGVLAGLPGRGHTVVQADLTDPEAVRRMVDRACDVLGGLDVLVNNAGAGVFRGIQDLTLDEWRKTIDLNLTGVFYCCHHALPLFRNQGAGYIIQISSLAGVNAFAGGAAYNASKFGLNGFSEAIMQDLRFENIRVSYIMPGSVDTGFGPRQGSADWKIAPEDIAEMVLHLLCMPARTLVSRVEMRPSKPKKNG